MGKRSCRESGIRFLLAPGLPGLEVVRLSGAPRSGGVGLHAHDSLIVAAVYAGARRLRLAAPGAASAGPELVAGPGGCCIVGPNRMHACSWDEGSAADCLCIKSTLLESFGFDSIRFDFASAPEAPGLHEAVRACAEACFRAHERERDIPDLRGLLRGVLERLARLERGPAPNSGEAVADPLEQARTLLEQSVAGADGPARCEELARAVGLTPWALSRGFVRAFGVPPRDYALDLRVRAAKQRIARGEPLACVALDTGFFDQSHLIRRFRALVGLTPGQYAAAFEPAEGRPAEAEGPEPETWP